MADRSIKVLIVDDNEDDFILLRRLLMEMENGKYVVQRAVDYSTGLPALAGNQFDVYLIDYRLGLQTGLELLKEAIARGCTAPLILLTGAGSHELDLAAMNMGAADYLIKSDITRDLLERSIRYSLKHASMVQKLRESEARFKTKSQMLNSLLSHLPVIAGRIDESGLITESAGAGLKTFGRNSHWSPGTNLSHAFPNVHDAIRKALGGESVNAPLQGTTSGQDWFSEIYFFFDSEKGSGAIFFALEVTERKRLEKELLEISSEEQRRIGRDLHDGLGQYLTGIACLSRALQDKLTAKALPDAADAEEIARLVNETIAQTRALARGLCPVELETHGLDSAIEEMCITIERVSRARCRFKSDHPGIANPTVALHLFRIAQEAINNAIKHGRANRIIVSLSASKKVNRLRIRDDGEGFTEKTGVNDGMGLKIMRYRAGMIGGSLRVEANRGRGATVTCYFQDPVSNYEQPRANPRRR